MSSHNLLRALPAYVFDVLGMAPDIRISDAPILCNSDIGYLALRVVPVVTWLTVYRWLQMLETETS